MRRCAKRTEKATTDFRQRLWPLADSRMTKRLRWNLCLLPSSKSPCDSLSLKRNRRSVLFGRQNQSHVCFYLDSCFVVVLLSRLFSGGAVRSRRSSIAIEPFFHPGFQFDWTEFVASALNLYPSFNLALMDEFVDMLDRVSEEGCCLAYTPRTLFMFEFVVWVHICLLLYPRVAFPSAARNLLAPFAFYVHRHRSRRNNSTL